MKKILANLLVLGSSASLMVACGGGGGGGAGPANSFPPATTATAEPNPITNPAPIGGGGAPGSSTPVAFNTSFSTLAVPVAGAGYPTLTVPANLQLALVAAQAAGSLSSVTATVNGSNVLVSLPANPAAGAPATTYLVPIPPAAEATRSVGDATAYNTSDKNSNIVVLNTTTPATLIYGDALGSIRFSTGLATPPSTPLSSSGCGASPLTPVNAVALANVNGYTYIGAGNNNGTVCAFYTNVSPFSNNNLGATNLSSMAGQRYVLGTPIGSLGFAPVNNMLYGQWALNNSPTDTIWQIVGQNGGGGPQTMTAQSFWNINSSAQQTSSNGSKVTFLNVPPSFNSTIMDANGNTYVGTDSGTVYKLAPGFSSWTYTSLGSYTGQVSLTPTTNNLGATATVVNNGTTYTFNVQ